VCGQCGLATNDKERGPRITLIDANHDRVSHEVLLECEASRRRRSAMARRRPRTAFHAWFNPERHPDAHALPKSGDCRTKRPRHWDFIIPSSFDICASSFLSRFPVMHAISIIRGQSRFQKDVDTLLTSHLASPLPSRVHRRGKQLHFIHEKEIHLTISLL
jgi:hypothetical protein